MSIKEDFDKAYHGLAGRAPHCDFYKWGLDLAKIDKQVSRGIVRTMNLIDPMLGLPKLVYCDDLINFISESIEEISGDRVLKPHEILLCRTGFGSKSLVCLTRILSFIGSNLHNLEDEVMPTNKKHMSIRMSVKTRERILRLQEELDAESMTEVIRKGLRVLDIVTQASSKGAILFIQNKDGTKDRVFFI